MSGVLLKLIFKENVLKMRQKRFSVLLWTCHLDIELWVKRSFQTLRKSQVQHECMFQPLSANKLSILAETRTKPTHLTVWSHSRMLKIQPISPQNETVLPGPVIYPPTDGDESEPEWNTNGSESHPLVSFSCEAYKMNLLYDVWVLKSTLSKQLLTFGATNMHSCCSDRKSTAAEQRVSKVYKLNQMKRTEAVTFMC